MINELRLLDIMNANRNNPQGLIAPEPRLDLARQLQDVERQPTEAPEDLGIAEQELRAMLGQIPQRTPVGKGRSVLGFLAGFGNTAEAGERAKYAKYYREMDQFKEKLDPVKALAVVEGQRRNTERQIRADDLRAKGAEDRLRSQEDIAAGKRRSETEERKIRQQRVDIERFRANNAGVKYFETVDGDIISVDIATRKATPLIDAEGDPIKTIHLTPAQQKEMAIEKITTAGVEARKNTALQGTIRTKLQDDAQAAASDLADKNIAGRVEVKKTASGTPANVKTQTDAQKVIGRNLRYQQIISARPELARYYKYDPKTKMITVLPLKDVKATDFWGKEGGIEKERMEALALLDPPTPRSGAGFNAPGALPDSLPAETSEPALGTKRADGKIFVRRIEDGQTGWQYPGYDTDKYEEK